MVFPSNKYKSRKVTVDGITFDSQKEYRRFCELRLLERAGKITDLELQAKYELIPSQRIGGKVVERACNYIADFRYKENGEVVVEDVKGYKQSKAYDIFAIKRKLMLWIHGIRVKEV